MDLDQKYNLLYAHEEAFSYRLAQEVVKKPETSAWMILLPVLFVHHIFKINQYKNGVRSFAQNFLSTKKKALDKAYDQVLAGQRMTYNTTDYFPGLEFTSAQEKALAEKQLQVILIMEEHFLELLEKPGQSLEELLRQTYRTVGHYRQYLKRLEDAEQELNRYLLKKVHTSEESRIVVRKIEEQCARLREEEIRLLFS